MRIIFNYCFIFAPCICNSYFSNRYILNDPFSDDRILDVTIHNGYISDRYFERQFSNNYILDTIHNG